MVSIAYLITPLNAPGTLIQQLTFLCEESCFNKLAWMACVAHEVRLSRSVNTGITPVSL